LSLPHGFDAPTREYLLELASGIPHVDIRELHAGYGNMEVLHGIDLMVGRGQSVCVIGPNGSGKSTLLKAFFGLADVYSGHVAIGGRKLTGASSRTMLTEAKVSYVLQTGSVFPDMTVEENLLVGGHVLKSRREAARAVELIFDSYWRLREFRRKPAGVLSGGERRLLELSRALITQPEVLLVDEPSIGLDPRTIDTIFEMLTKLQRGDGKTIVMVEQNAKSGLEIADLGYVLVAGQVALVDRAPRLLENARVGQLFLGG
jgi:branched-chain amino acid transport system ATP-binding protein